MRGVFSLEIMSKAKRRKQQNAKAKTQIETGRRTIETSATYDDSKISERAAVIELCLNSCPSGDLANYHVPNKGLTLININKQYFVELIKFGLEHYGETDDDRTRAAAILEHIVNSNTVIFRLEKSAEAVET